MFRFWLGPEKLRDFEKLPPGVGKVLACTVRESEEKGKKNATDALFVFERKKKKKKLGEQQGLLSSRVFYESPARFMFF